MFTVQEPCSVFTF